MKSCFNTDNHSNFDLYDVTFIEFHEFIAYHHIWLQRCRRITVPNPISRIFLRRSNRKYRFVTLVIYASLDPHPICFNTSRILYFTKLHCINKLVWINSSRRMSPECFIKSILLSIFFIIQNSRKIRSKELFLTGTKKKIYLSERHFLSRIIFPSNGKKKKNAKRNWNNKIRRWIEAAN